MVGAHHAQGDRLLGVELLGRFRAGLEQLVADAGRQRGLRDVDDQVGHLGLARQLAQHLLQLSSICASCCFSGSRLAARPCLSSNSALQVRFLRSSPSSSVRLVGDEEPPGQADDHQADRARRATILIARPGAGVAGVQIAQRPSCCSWLALRCRRRRWLGWRWRRSGAGGVAARWRWRRRRRAGVAAGRQSATRHPPVPPSTGQRRLSRRIRRPAAAAAAAAVAGSLGFFSVTFSENSFGRPGSPPLASMIDRSGLPIQPERSRLRM